MAIRGRAITSQSRVENNLVPRYPGQYTLGTLQFPFKSLFVDDITPTDDIVFSVPFTAPVLNTGTIAAAGTTQANATAIVNTNQQVTGANGTTGVRLPALANLDVGLPVTVINAGASTLRVYSNAAGELINGVAGTTSFNIAPGDSVVFLKFNNTNWYADHTSVPVVVDVATLAAAGSTQADAAVVASRFARVTGASGTNGVRVPALATVPNGYEFIVNNSSTANALRLYSNSGVELLSGQSGTTAIVIPAKVTARVIKFDASNWYVALGVTPY